MVCKSAFLANLYFLIEVIAFINFLEKVFLWFLGWAAGFYAVSFWPKKPKSPPTGQAGMPLQPRLSGKKYAQNKNYAAAIFTKGNC